MRKPLLLAAALALTGVTGLALAQTAPSPAAPPAPQAQALTPPPPPGPQAQAPMPVPPGGPRGPGMEGPGPMRGWHHRHAPSRAASFHIERDDSAIHIRCAEGESTRACVDAAVVLLDKVGSMPAR
ncbi:hypothetical protein [Roseomonas chloroacetimidivorans]|uniref:hypothetical protein n=1 Tax=Roseomonas chloroacetimidivorans TaxID=1766656 RepID=UPI003C772E14